MKTNRPLFAVTIILLAGLVACLDAVTPPEVPTDALYTLPICLGLIGFGLRGGLTVSTVAIGLFYISNYQVAHDPTRNLGPAILITYCLFLLFSWGAHLYLKNQRQLEQTRLDLQNRLLELDRLYQQSQELHLQNLRLAVTEERNRLAREIHDVLAQGLAAIIFQIEAAQLDPGDRLVVEQRLQQISQLAHHNLQEARLSVANLRPLSLVDISLDQALERKVEDFNVEQAQAGTRASYHTSKEPHEQALSPEVERALYRIAQEALTNVARHARASEVLVNLDFDDEEEEVYLTIQDNGVGFDIANFEMTNLTSNGAGSDQTEMDELNKRSGRFGLSSMQERASLIGGWATIQSQPGEGCRVRVIVPYARAFPVTSVASAPVPAASASSGSGF